MNINKESIIGNVVAEDYRAAAFLNRRALISAVMVIALLALPVVNRISRQMNC